MTYLTHLPHLRDSFRASLVQTTRHKIDALEFVFSRLLKVDLQQMGREIERKNCCVSVLHPISTDGPRHLLLRRGSSLERLFYPLQSKKKFVVVAVRVLSLFFPLVFVQELGVANVIH